MTRFDVGDFMGFDAGRFGKAIFRVTGFTELADETRVYEVDVLKSTHDEFPDGGRGQVTVGNNNLIQPADEVDTATLTEQLA